MDSSTILITGSNGQLGIALQAKYPEAKTSDMNELNISDQAAVEAYEWDPIKIILNAAAYTNVDEAETEEGQMRARLANSVAVSNLAKVAKEKDIVIVHISTDYVFDGTKAPHTEDEPFSPLSVYGRTKAEGDKILAELSKHYILRTSWVIGEGKNFVRTMIELGKKGINPSVVSDQIGRLTFTTELVRAIDHLLSNKAPYGTYNVSNEGEPTSWADITREIFKDCSFSNVVNSITTKEYFKDKPKAAPRPLNSVLDLAKIEATGFKPHDWHDDLAAYVKKELSL